MSAQRILLLLVALAAIAFGAVHGRQGQCNGITITRHFSTTTLQGCGGAPAWILPVSVSLAALATVLACRRLPGDRAEPRVRLLVVAGVGLALVGFAVVMFAALRPGLVEVAPLRGEVLCHRPISDLNLVGSGGDRYAPACRELGERRLLIAESVGFSVFLAVVAISLVARRRTADSSLPEV